jgi:hypothetical protein
MTLKSKVFIGIVLVLSFSSCSKKQTTQAVCVDQNVAVKASPQKNAPAIFALSLWDTLLWLGDSSKGNDNKTYYKIQSSDNKIGWVSASGIALNALVALVKDSTELFAKPDTNLTLGVKLPFLTLVAASIECGNFASICGIRKEFSGWVHKEDITLNQADVQTAIAVNREILAAGNNITEDFVKGLVDKVNDPHSFILQKLQEKAAGKPILPPSDSAQASQVPQSDTGADMTKNE